MIGGLNSNHLFIIYVSFFDLDVHVDFIIYVPFFYLEIDVRFYGDLFNSTYEYEINISSVTLMLSLLKY